ncbi:hypothetical protein C6N75_12890 [Streptomyces solincola]|uniref:Phosphodiester glycosidase domain-containing protein n=1 Tax=Streptomyces solincola TaxID=2100817 RepID=A0A2S9PWP0_9ACTN|nr:hypothetical protein C6N75_12890 [Streptomyces solincola]
MLAVVALLVAGLAGAPPARPATTWVRVADGVAYRWKDLPSPRGTARAHLLSVDLDRAGVSLGLLYPGAVAARSALSSLADGAAAVGGVNGDFFHLTETQHPGVPATGAPVGPAVADGRALKAAVPRAQRYGPALPPGANARQVWGVGTDGTARLGELTLDGAVSSAAGAWPLGGLNQYALAEGSVGLFTSDWGSAPRARAVCGSDARRDAPCVSDAYEVTVRAGRVVSAASAPGGGTIPDGTLVLVGREKGADRLRELAVGERVRVRYGLVAAGGGAPFRFAVGGFPVLRGGAPVPGLDGTVAAVRTAAGIGESGRRVWLLALDGSPGFRDGLTLAELAGVLAGLGASEAVNLDGGGSSTLVARDAGASAVRVLNHPSGGAQRPVPNGVGVFAGG